MNQTIIADLIRAVQAGQQLSNPAAWKKGQELTNLTGAVVAGIIVAIRYFFPTVFIPEGITEYAPEAIGTVLVLINLYLTRATTKNDLSLSSMGDGNDRP